MPRKRHDTSSEDSDSSDNENRHRNTGRHSSERKSQNQSYEGTSKKSKGGRNGKNTGHDLSNDSIHNQDRRPFSSDTDSSPAKRSVVSKVEKASSRSGRKDRHRDDDYDRRDQFEAPPITPRSIKREISSPDERRDERFSSQDRGRRRESRSPVRQRSVSERSDNRHQDRSNSNERGDNFRNDRYRRSSSPDRNAGRYATGRGRDNRSPSPPIYKDHRSPAKARGGGWRDQGPRDRNDSRNRGQGQGYRNDQWRGRSFESQNEDDRSRSMNRSRDRSSPERNQESGRRPQSPVGRRARNDSDISFEKTAISPESQGRRQQFQQQPQRGRNYNDHAQNSPSPVRSLGRGQRSISPRQTARNVPEERSQKEIKKERLSQSISPVKPKRSNPDKQAKASRSRDQPPSDIESEDDRVETMSNISKKSKEKKKKKKKNKDKDEKDESVERSFERSKKLLESSTDFDKTEPEFSDAVSPLKSQKRSKRQRETSESDEVVPKKSKKSKDGTSKKSKKKAKISVSRSPSPTIRSRSHGRNNSRSRERSFGRNHDMAKFESEPESGEITDSEEDRGEVGEHGRQPMKSFINKPMSDDGAPQKNADDNASNHSKKVSKKRDKTGSDKRDNGKRQDRDRGSKRKAADVEKAPSPTPEPPQPKKPKADIEMLTGRTGGAYIPPARLRAMQAKITDKSSVEFQRISWEALKKSINGLVNKVNVANIENIVREIFQENIVRGRGLMARSIIQAQAASPTFTHVYAALVAIVNTKFPQNGELILRRLILQFRRGYKRNDKSICLSATQFIAHLVNQQVAHELLALEILTLLMETPTDDSVEVAIGFLKECGQKLTEVSPRGINAIFERLRNILHEGQIDIRVQYMAEVMFAVRKDHFKDFPSITADLDLVEEEDQFTHLLTLEEAVNGEEILNVFKADPNFEENEEKYKILKKEILGEGSSDEEGSGSDSDSDSEDDSDEEQDEEEQQKIIDQTETNMVALRRTIYLTIQSSLDFEECAHKLMKMELRPGQEVELCNMILDCCAQMRTYEKFFGLLAGRFCMLDRKYVEPFQVMFKEQYDTIHRLETNKLRNVAKFFAHLLHTDSISWAVLQAIKLNEDDTTSASRIFIKILFQELSEYLGLPKLNERLKDPTLQEYYAGLLPRDNPRDTRFAINFFTTIGLGGLTDDLRDHLKDVSKKLMQQKQEEQTQAAMEVASSDDSSDNSSSDDSGDSSDSSSSDSDSDSSEDDRRKKKKNKKATKKVETKKSKDKNRKEREKNSRKEKETTNGTFDRMRGRDNNMDKVGKKDKKKVKPNEEEKRREQEAQFKKLAKLADYGDIDSLAPSFQEDRDPVFDDRRSGKKDRKEKRGKDDRGKKRNKDLDNSGYDERRSRNRSDVDELDEFDARKYADRSFDTSSSYGNRDGSGREDGRNGGGNRRRRDDQGAGPVRGVSREGRGGREDRGSDRGGGFDERKSGKGDRERGRDTSRDRGPRDKSRGRKGRGDFVDEEEDNRGIKVERNFERMDLYEEKFEREREKNIEQLRDREEFQDYYRGRDRDDSPPPRRGPSGGKDRDSGRDRGDMPYKGGRNRDRDSGDNLEYADERRGKNRSEAREGRNERRRR